MATTLGLLGAPATAQAPSGGGDIRPQAIAAGPDGNMWFTESGSAAKGIGRITPDGTITEFTVPDSISAHRWGIAAGPDGNLWFTETFGSNGIGRISTSGVVTHFPVPSAAPTGIAAGPDGNMWWASEGMIGKISPTGDSTEYPIPDPAGYNFSANGLAAGPDGNMWFTLMTQNRIGRITPAGVFTQFALPTPLSRPVGIAAGPDGNMWFTESGGNRIGRITPAGAITEYPLPLASSSSHGIAAGPDGSMWFTESGGNGIGRITPAGTITEFPLRTSGSNPHGIAAGPDGNMWFTEPSGNRIGRITPEGVVTEYSVPIPHVAKTPCPVDVALHNPAPKTVGKRVLIDRINTNTSACGLREPVVTCTPLGTTAAGKKSACTTKATTRGKIRVNTRKAVRVTVFVRAKPKPGQTDSWKPHTWGKAWILRKQTPTTDLALSKGLISGMDAAGVDIKAIRGATMSKSGAVTFRVTSTNGGVITNKGGLRFLSATGFVTLQNITLDYTTGKASASVEATAVPTGMQITGLLTFTGGENRLTRNGAWRNAKVTLATSTSAGNPAPLFASPLGLPAGSIASGMTSRKATITLKR